jgi:hypothetical protein
VGDIFVGSKQNFSNTWGITWAYHMKSPNGQRSEWETETNVTGYATGLKNPAWQTNVKSILKVIYDGVVDTWPTDW